MLEPQVVVNLLPKLGVGVDLVRHGSWRMYLCRLFWSAIITRYASVRIFAVFSANETGLVVAWDSHVF